MYAVCLVPALQNKKANTLGQVEFEPFNLGDLYENYQQFS